MPAEDIDDLEPSKPESNFLRGLIPLPQEYRHLTDSFDRGSIYAACQSAFANKNSLVGNIHCFYFGFKGPVHEAVVWKMSNKEKLNRVLLLEEMLHTAKFMYSLDSITLTTLFMVKHRLVTKEHMKDIYKNPKDPELKFNNRTLLEQVWYAQIDGHEKPEEMKSSQIFLDYSFHDDLEQLCQLIKQFNAEKLPIDQKFLFFFPMLAKKNDQKAKILDQEFLTSFYCYPKNPDVTNEEMIKSNSKSKYEFWDGLRTFLSIPSDDYPFFYDDGNFILPLCDDLMFHSFFQFMDIEIHENYISFIPLLFSQYDINFCSKNLTKRQISLYIQSQLLLKNWKRKFPIPSDYRFLYLQNYKPGSSKFSITKEKGERVTCIDQQYVDECQCPQVIGFDSKLSFTFQTESIVVLESAANHDEVYLAHSWSN